MRLMCFQKCRTDDGAYYTRKRDTPVLLFVTLSFMHKAIIRRTDDCFMHGTQSQEQQNRRVIKPKPPQQIPCRTPFKDIAETFRVLGRFCMKTVEICCSKTCVNFGRCYGIQRWAETVENQILFLKISSFENSESFNSVAQGVLEIF